MGKRRRTRKRPPTLTADNQMTPKPNSALNAQIESSGRAANGTRNNWPARPSRLGKHRVINHGGQQRAAGACKKCWEMLGAATRHCPKTDRRDEKGHLGNPTTTARRHYASRPSAGIDRPKCLISLKATGEQVTILFTVQRGLMDQGDARRSD